MAVVLLISFTYISTAGGAFLEWLEGKTLPGVAVLDVQNRKKGVYKCQIKRKLYRCKQVNGFIAALDQSGGSTPKAHSKLYGVEEERLFIMTKKCMT